MMAVSVRRKVKLLNLRLQLRLHKRRKLLWLLRILLQLLLVLMRRLLLLLRGSGGGHGKNQGAAIARRPLWDRNRSHSYRNRGRQT